MRTALDELHESFIGTVEILRLVRSCEERIDFSFLDIDNNAGWRADACQCNWSIFLLPVHVFPCLCRGVES
jgi:hypothetical protein